MLDPDYDTLKHMDRDFINSPTFKSLNDAWACESKAAEDHKILWQLLNPELFDVVLNYSICVMFKGTKVGIVVSYPIDKNMDTAGRGFVMTTDLINKNLAGLRTKSNKRMCRLMGLLGYETDRQWTNLRDVIVELIRVQSEVIQVSAFLV